MYLNDDEKDQVINILGKVVEAFEYGDGEKPLLQVVRYKEIEPVFEMLLKKRNEELEEKYKNIKEDAYEAFYSVSQGGSTKSYGSPEE